MPQGPCWLRLQLPFLYCIAWLPSRVTCLATNSLPTTFACFKSWSNTSLIVSEQPSLVEVPPLTVDHAITLDLSIRLHSPTSIKGGEVVKFQWCAARWHLVPIARWIFKNQIKHSWFFEVPFWQKNWECVLRRYSFRYPIRMKNKVVYLTERRGINQEQVSILGQNVLSTYISY